MYGEGQYYFAYGSNMNARRVAARKMVFSSYEGGVLPDYRLAFNKRSVKQPGAASANVIAAPGHRVEGVVYELPGAGEIETMDPFEGHPVRYLRQRLPVICGDGTVLAWVYLANGEFIEEGLRPARWYLEHLLAGRPYLSNEYVNELLQVACLPDSHVEPL